MELTKHFQLVVVTLFVVIGFGTVTPIQIECNSPDPFPYPGSCTKYYSCMILEGAFVHSVFECQPGSYFNPDKNLCTLGQCPAQEGPVEGGDVITRTRRAVATRQATKPSCPSEGLFPSPDNCQDYYQCVRIRGQMYYYTYRCQDGTHFSSTYNRCAVGKCPV